MAEYARLEAEDKAAEAKTKVERARAYNKVVSPAQSEALYNRAHADALYKIEEAVRQAARRNAIERAEAKLSEDKKRQAAAAARAELNQALNQAEAELKQAKRQLRVLRLCLQLRVLGNIKAEAACRQQVRAGQAAKREAAKHAAAAADQADKATTRAAAKKAQAELNQAKRKLRVRRRVLEGIKRPRQLLKPTKPPQPSHVSQHHARVLIQICKYKKHNKTSKGSTLLSTIIKEQILELPLLSSTNKQEQIEKQNTSTLVTKCKNEESIEEMVQRVDRELDEEFRSLQPASADERAAAAAEAPKSRVPLELEELESENNNFNNNFLEVATKEATRPLDPNTNPTQWELIEEEEKVQPQRHNYLSKRRPDGNERPANRCFHIGGNK